MTGINRVFLDPQTGIWVGHNLEHDIYSQGETEEAAWQAIESAVELYLRNLPPREVEP